MCSVWTSLFHSRYRVCKRWEVLNFSKTYLLELGLKWWSCKSKLHFHIQAVSGASCHLPTLKKFLTWVYLSTLSLKSLIHRCYCLLSTNHAVHTVIKLSLMRKYLWFEPRIATLSEASRLLRDISDCFVSVMFSLDFLLTNSPEENQS